MSKAEWHRVTIFRPRLADTVLASVKKGAHVLIEGSLVSSTYEKADGKGKKTNGVKLTSWSIRADAVRKLDRGEPEPAAPVAPDDAPPSTDGIDYAKLSRQKPALFFFSGPDSDRH